MIYLRAGLYAEGPSDYHFLRPLLDRLLDAVAAPLLPAAYEVGATLGIDAPKGTEGGRAEQIAAAIGDAWEECTLFVIHADGASDPEDARRSRVEPGVKAARAADPGRPVSAAACVPVREIEAWLLADPEAFRVALGGGAVPVLPADPEREVDPKVTLRHILKEGGARRQPERLYSLFGERVRIEALRALPAFRVFEGELIDAVREVARLQGASI